MAKSDGCTPSGYDDFLNLAERDFSTTRLLAFTGSSGSGKSTAMRFLQSEHPQFQEDAEWLNGRPIATAAWRASHRLVFVDELLRLRDLVGVARLLARGHRVVVASHLPESPTRGLGLFWKTVSLRTDRDASKLSRHLQRRGIEHSLSTLESFVRSYTASYACLELVLERAPQCESFDEAWRRFRRTTRLAKTGVENSTPAP